MNFKEELEKHYSDYVDAWFKENVDLREIKTSLLASAKEGFAAKKYLIKKGSFERIRSHMDEIIDRLSKELDGVEVSEERDVIAEGFVPLVFRWSHK